MVCVSVGVRITQKPLGGFVLKLYGSQGMRQRKITSCFLYLKTQDDFIYS